MKSLDPQIKEPIGQAKPFDRQKVTESTFSINCFNEMLRATVALNILAPSICNLILFSFAMIDT